MEPITSFSGEYSFLSNFYPAKVKIRGDDDNYIYPTVEHAYQASKTTDWAERDLFKKETVVYKGKIVPLTAGMSKKLGKTVTLRWDWEVIKLARMTELVYDKFEIPELKEKLLATRGRDLIEGNYWGDTFWGVCNGEGKNHLGRILMMVRSYHVTEGMNFYV